MCDHPNVLSCYASFVHENELWLVMEFMSKGSCLHIMNVAKKEVKAILIACTLGKILWVSVFKVSPGSVTFPSSMPSCVYPHAYSGNLINLVNTYGPARLMVSPRRERGMA